MSNSPGRCKVCHHPTGPIQGRASRAICHCECHYGKTIVLPEAIMLDFFIVDELTPVSEAVDMFISHFSKKITRTMLGKVKQHAD